MPAPPLPAAPAEAGVTPHLPDTAEVRALAARMVSDELVVVPVRHHSPACAHAVERAFDRHQPSAVLVEGPRSFTPLVDLLASPEARYPLAVFAFARPTGAGGPAVGGRGGYYPFCDYSPELVAVRRAVAAGVPASFIDLDVAEQARLDEAVADDPAGWSLLDERVFEHSRALEVLARRLGCRDQEDLWELLFEADDAVVDLDEHLARMTAYCLLARRDRTDDDLRRDGTLAREAEMAFHVREALAARRPGDGPVLVVVGGFHGVVLPGLLADPPPRPRIEVGPVDTGQALIRYTFERLERLHGYGAGMTAPGWHQRVWDERRRGLGPGAARRDAALGALLDVAEVMRSRFRTPVSTPSLAAAHHHLSLLADLRRRPAPLRSDLLDAVTSCLVAGEVDTEGALVQGVTGRVLTGDRIGTVPPGAGTPPLVEDTLTRLRELRLKVDDPEARTLALDLYRNPAHRRTSRVLHGLTLIGVPFARHEAGPDFVRGTGLARLQERWSYAWTPVAEGALVEASLLGSTLPEAVRAAYARLVAEATVEGRVPASPEAVSLLARAAVLGLHDEADAAVAMVRVALAGEPALPAVVGATGGLALLTEGREPLEATRLTALPELVAAGYARALFVARGLQGEECEPEHVATCLARLRELLASPAGEPLDPEPYWSVVHHLRRHHDAPLVRGAAAGLAHAAGRIDDDELARDVRGHLAGTTPATEAVGFLRGLLATAREAVWQDVGLVPALDDRFGAWDESTFLGHLPDLRLAFSELTPRETDRVAALVAGLHGLPDGIGPLLVRDADEGSLARNAALALQVAALVEADGLGAWLPPGGAPP